MEEKQIELQASKPLTVREEPSIGMMLQAFLQQGITSENANALDKILGVYERMQDRQAEKEFASAFAALQSELPAIKAIKPVPDKQGNVKYRFAPFEEIMEELQPYLNKHGFTVSFDTAYSDGRLNSKCTRQHIGGHSKTNNFAVRIGGGPPGCNEMQADGAARSYAKRGALCDAFNIVIDHDTDGDDQRGVGDLVTQEQADYLRKGVVATGTSEGSFLKFAGAANYEGIPASRYNELSEMLRRKADKRA